MQIYFKKIVMILASAIVLSSAAFASPPCRTTQLMTWYVSSFTCTLGGPQYKDIVYNIILRNAVDFAETRYMSCTITGLENINGPEPIYCLKYHNNKGREGKKCSRLNNGVANILVTDGVIGVWPAATQTAVIVLDDGQTSNTPVEIHCDLVNYPNE